MSAVKVHVSHAYKNTVMTRKCISLILEPIATFLSFHCSCGLGYLEKYFGLNPSSDTITPRYLKVWAVTSFLLSMIMSALMLLVLFVINWFFPVLICMPYAGEVSPRCFIKLTGSCPPRLSVSSANRQFVISKSSPLARC